LKQITNLKQKHYHNSKIKQAERSSEKLKVPIIPYMPTVNVISKW